MRYHTFTETSHKVSHHLAPWWWGRRLSSKRRCIVIHWHGCLAAKLHRSTKCSSFALYSIHRKIDTLGSVRVSRYFCIRVCCPLQLYDELRLRKILCISVCSHLVAFLRTRSYHRVVCISLSCHLMAVRGTSTWQCGTWLRYQRVLY